MSFFDQRAMQIRADVFLGLLIAWLLLLPVGYILLWKAALAEGDGGAGCLGALFGIPHSREAARKRFTTVTVILALLLFFAVLGAVMGGRQRTNTGAESYSASSEYLQPSSNDAVTAPTGNQVPPSTSSNRSVRGLNSTPTLSAKEIAYNAVAAYGYPIIEMKPFDRPSDHRRGRVKHWRYEFYARVQITDSRYYETKSMIIQVVPSTNKTTVIMDEDKVKAIRNETPSLPHTIPIRNIPANSSY